MLHGFDVPNKCSEELYRQKDKCSYNTQNCTRTYVRVHMYAYIFRYFGAALSIKRTSSTEINKTLIILTLLFSCRFSSLNLHDGSSAVLIQVRRLQRLRRNCICDQNLLCATFTPPISLCALFSQLRNAFFPTSVFTAGSFFPFPGSATVYSANSSLLASRLASD